MQLTSFNYCFSGQTESENSKMGQVIGSKLKNYIEDQLFNKRE